MLFKRNGKFFRESLENCENFKIDFKFYEDVLEEEDCLFKLKIVKLKKMKNGKLLFVEGKIIIRES